MADLAHWYSADLQVGATGGLGLADGDTLGLQRVLRRLLTNPGDYLWHRNYGAGLGRFVGKPVAPQRIVGLVRYQLALESVVAPNPPPTVAVTWTTDGSVFLSIAYTDAPSQVPQILSFSVGQAGVTVTQAGP